jgi:hypothetical protein
MNPAIKLTFISDPSDEEVLLMVAGNFRNLSTYLYNPSRDIHFVYAQLPNVTVTDLVDGEEIKFVHVYRPLPRCGDPVNMARVAALFHCGTVPTGCRSCLVKKLIQPHRAGVFSIPVPDDAAHAASRQPATLAELVGECVEYVKALLSDGRQGAMNPRCLVLLILALGSADLVLHLQRSMGNGSELDPAFAESAACFRDRIARFETRLAARRVNRLLYSDPDIAGRLTRERRMMQLVARVEMDWKL